LERFQQRFRWIGRRAGKPLREATPAELDALWEQAKAAESGAAGATSGT
jgi:hypothetical protein